MDDRQTEIRQGEGLSESRVNQDFVDFLNKWSSPVLMVLAVAALAYAGMQWMSKKKVEKVNSAFRDLGAAVAGGNPSPASLKTLATEYKGVRAVPELALLQTTDIYLSAYIRGIEPGTVIDPVTGLPTDDAGLLDDTQRSAYLDQAGQLAQQVIDLTEGKSAKAVLAIQAKIRLAVVHEGKRDFESAKATYLSAVAIATENGFPVLAKFAQKRAEETSTLSEVQGLPSNDQLMALPGEGELSDDIINEILNPSFDLPVEGAVDAESDNEPTEEPDVEAGEPVGDPEPESAEPAATP